jgi:hypothetical protein
MCEETFYSYGNSVRNCDCKSQPFVPTCSNTHYTPLLSVFYELYQYCAMSLMCSGSITGYLLKAMKWVKIGRLTL